MTVLIALLILLAGVTLGWVLRGPGNQHILNCLHADRRDLEQQVEELQDKLDDANHRLLLCAGAVIALPDGPQ